MVQSIRGPVDESGARAASSEGTLKVFVSYSRRDSSFANELLTGLQIAGFEPFLDTHDIAPGEPWEARLGRLIESADTVVFVISPNSVASDHCQWEVEQTEKLGKRLLPVVWQPVEEGKVPDRLKRLNYVYFDKEHSFAPALASLAEALRTDLGWVREHTRLLQRAQEWLAAGKPENRLLSGQDIAAAKAWLAKTGAAQHLSPTELHRDFIQASDQAEALHLSAERKRADELQDSVRRTRLALAGALALALLAAGTAGLAYLSQLEAHRQKTAAETARTTLAAKVDELSSANLRLDADMPAYISLSGEINRTAVGGNWHKYASIYLSSTALVRTAETHRTMCTGFVIKGATLYEGWGDRPVAVLASHCVSVSAKDYDINQLQPKDAELIFPISNDGTAVRLSEVLWVSGPDHADVSVIRIDGPLPQAVQPIEHVNQDELTAIPIVPDMKVGFENGQFGIALRPQIGMFGALYGGPISLLVTNLMGRSMNGDLLYPHVTGPGMSGAPVFDLQTGVLYGIHNGGSNDSEVSSGHLPLAAAKSITGIKAAIKADLTSKKPGNQPPLAAVPATPPAPN